MNEKAASKWKFNREEEEDEDHGLVRAATKSQHVEGVKGVRFV